MDSGGKPVPGVTIKAFANGVLAASARTDGDGRFTLAAHPMREEKGSAVIWFQSPDAQLYVDTSIVVWAGKTALEHHLFPECTQFLKTIGGAANVEVTMRSVAERGVAVMESKCFEGEVPTSSP